MSMVMQAEYPIIMGRLIPAGSGFPMYKDIKPVKLGEEISVEDLLGGDPLGLEEKD